MVREKDNTKELLIFEHSLRRVLAYGYTGLNIKDVSADCNIATGTFYLYFDNKEDLINRLYLHIKAEKSQRLISKIPQNQPFVPTFRAAWFAYFDICLSQPEKMIFLEQFYRSAYLSADTRAIADQFMLPLISIVEAGQAQELIIDLPAPLILMQIMGGIHEIVKYLTDKQIVLSDSQKQAFFASAYNGLRR